METKHHRALVDRPPKWNCKIPLPPGVVFSPQSWHVSIHYWHLYFDDKEHRYEVYCWPLKQNETQSQFWAEKNKFEYLQVDIYILSHHPLLLL